MKFHSACSVIFVFESIDISNAFFRFLEENTPEIDVVSVCSTFVLPFAIYSSLSHRPVCVSSVLRELDKRPAQLARVYSWPCTPLAAQQLL